MYYAKGYVDLNKNIVVRLGLFLIAFIGTGSLASFLFPSVFSFGQQTIISLAVAVVAFMIGSQIKDKK
ncbi:hypothetical protein WSSLDB02_10170 [Weissella soli]|nr:hypothetical protein WSSLDB02_10170 [Weissella soli]